MDSADRLIGSDLSRGVSTLLAVLAQRAPCASATDQQMRLKVRQYSRYVFKGSVADLTLIQIRKSSADYFSGAGLDRRAHRMANIKLDAGVGL